MKPVQRSFSPARSTSRCASSWRRPTRRGHDDDRARAAEDGLARARSGRCGRAPPPQPASRPPAATAAQARLRGEKQYACVMHIDSERPIVKRRMSASVCLPHSVGVAPLARSPDAPSPPPPAARRRPPVPHRRRPRDHADLPPRARPAVLRRLRPAQGRRRPRRAARLLRALPRPRARARRGLRPRHRDVARQPRLGARGSATRSTTSTPPTASAVALAEEIRAAGEAEGTPIVINGVVGPRGDGYDPGELMSPDEARGLPRPAGRDVRRQRRRHGHRGHDDHTPTRRSASPAPPAPTTSPRSSPSRSRPTGACPTASRCAPPSSASTPRPAARSPTS